MLIHNANVTGSMHLNGMDMSTLTGSVSSTTFNQYTSSTNEFTGSANTRLNSLDSSSGSFSTRVTSLESFSSSLDATFATDAQLSSLSSSVTSRFTTDESDISSLQTASGSFSTRITSNESNISGLQTASESFSTRTTNLETASGSFSTRVTNNESNISSLQTASGSFSTRVTNNESSLTSLNSKSGSFATTGSNTFTGTQTITGSLFITQNLTVLGSSSISYVSQSNLNIGTNLITVNAQNPSVRFGGLAVLDSGSSPQVSGSWLFDSIQNRWIMIHEQAAGNALTSSIALMGPETYNNLGNETQISANRLIKGYPGASGEHVGNSNISDNGSVVSINSNTQVTGSLTVNGVNTVLENRTLTINGTTFDLSANRSWSITAGISAVSAGTGISTSTLNGVATVTNTGLLTGTAGTGISVFTSNQNLTITNTGLLTGTAGTGISVSTVNQNLTITNTGLLSGAAGAGINVSTTNQQLTITNTGLLTGAAGTGISVSTVNQQLTITNTGLLSGAAGTGISVSTANQQLTITNTGVTSFNTRTGGVTLQSSDISGLGAGLVSGSSQIDHNATTNYVANRHIDHSAVSISAGSGLTGGGDITTTRTLSIATGGVTNSMLANSTISGIALGSNLATLTIGTGLSGTSYNGGTAVTIANTGVTSLTAGSGISISASTGGVTITNTITNNNQLTNGAGYITGITSGNVTTALGYTPYNSTNPSGYITGITSGMVTTALGYTPYNSSNPSGYITSSALSSYLALSGGTMTGAITTPAGTAIYIGNQNVSTSSRLIINWHTDSDYNYLIGKRAGAWTQPMDISFYTGIRYHAHQAYNAHIFYVNGYDSTEAFSIGKGDSNVRVNNVLFVSGDARAPIFYDQNNTGFYLDPASTSYLNLLGVADYQYIAGQTINGQSHFQWEGATFRNPGSYNTALIVRRDNSTTGINGSYPSLTLYNNNGANQTTAHLAFASAEGATGAGNSVALAGIIAKKEAAGNVGGWSPGSLTFYTKNFGTRVDAQFIGSDGRVGFSTTDFSFTANDNTRAVGSTTNNTVFVNGSIQLLSNNDAIVIGRGAATFLSDEELGFGWGGGLFMTDGTFLRVRNGGSGIQLYTPGIIRADGDMRATIFYDQNNTGYYLDPTSSTSIRTVGSWRADSSSWDGEFSGKMQYHSNHWYIQGADLFIYRNSGGSNVFTVTQGGVAQASADFRAPIFYDSNDTGRYIDPASTSQTNSMRASEFRGNANVGGTGEATWHPAGAYIGGTMWQYGAMYKNNTDIYDISIGYANSSFRAPIFYDSNDTGYYADFNSTSDSALRVRGGALFGPNPTWGAFLYVGTNGRVGTSATVAVTNGNLHLDSQNGYQMYLNWYSTEAVWTGGSLGVGAASASHRLHVHGTGFATSDFRAPIFYDSNNTGYYLDPASTSVVNVLQFGTSSNSGRFDGESTWGVRFRTDGGYIWFGPANTGHAHIYTDRSNFYFNAPLTVNDGSYINTNDIRSAIFYDRGDTGYYLDPNDTSNLWRFTQGTLDRHSLNSRQVNSPWSTRSGQGVLYQTGAMGWGQNDFNVIGSNWGSGFFDTWSNPGNAPGGSSHYVGIQAFHYNNSDSSRFHGWQMACAQEANNRWFLRSAWDTPRAWVEIIHGGNIGSQTVSNSDMVDGYHVAVGGSANTLPTRDANGYLAPNNWIQLNGIYGFYAPTNGAHFYPNNGTYGSWRSEGTRGGWQGIEFGSGANGAVVLMVNPSSNTTGFHNNSYGWQFYWEGGVLYVGKNAYGGGTTATVVDSTNIASYTAGNVNNISSAVGGGYTWTGINYFRTNFGGYCGSLDSGRMQAYSDSNNSAFFSFHKGGHYATNMGLDADNVIRIGGWSAAANRWQLDMSGNMTVAGDVTAYSDARVKTNVNTIENALEKTLALRGVTYNRTDSEDVRTKVGVIAQEIIEVLPEVVNQDNDGMYNVSYGNITALLIEAIKEQQSQIEELKSIVNALTK